MEKSRRKPRFKNWRDGTDQRGERPSNVVEAWTYLIAPWERDGLIRTVSIKTPSGTTQRALQKICLLPIKP